MKECGINERASFAEIRKILDATSDPEEQKELLTKNHDKLISRTVTVDDIFASVNYLLGLDHGIGVTDEIDHLGAALANCCRTSSASALPVWSALCASA